MHGTLEGDNQNVIGATVKNTLSEQRGSREESPFSDLITKLILDRDRQSTDPSKEDDLEGNIDFLSGVTSTQSEEIHVESTKAKPDRLEENPWVERPSKFERTDIFQDEGSQIYVTSDSSSDDFYSKFRRADSTLGSPYSPEPSLEEVIDYTRVEPEQGTTKYGQDNMLSKLGDTWTEFLAPGISSTPTNQSWSIDINSVVVLFYLRYIEKIVVLLQHSFHCFCSLCPTSLRFGFNISQVIPQVFGQPHY